MSGIQLGAEQRAPVVADVAQLAGERGRCVARRGAQQVDQRRGRAVTEIERLARPECPLDTPERVEVARALGEVPVVDELVQRTDRGVLVADPGE